MLKARIQVLGEDHPDTLNATANLANTLHALGDLPRPAPCKNTYSRPQPACSAPTTPPP